MVIERLPIHSCGYFPRACHSCLDSHLSALLLYLLHRRSASGKFSQLPSKNTLFCLQVWGIPLLGREFQLSTLVFLLRDSQEKSAAMLVFIPLRCVVFL